LEQIDHGLEQIRSVQEVPEIVHEARMPENIVAARAVFLDHLQMRETVTADETGRISEKFPPRQ
jgi:hypothetical protein